MSLLKVAGTLSACVALLHAFIIFRGGPAYRYFGAGERMARLAEGGSPGPTLVTAGLTVLFAVWAAYAFAGAGVIRRLPCLRAALLAIGVVYTLRGLVVVPQLVWRLSGHAGAAATRHLVFSAAALLTGMAYLAGTRRAWAALAGRTPAQRG